MSEMLNTQGSFIGTWNTNTPNFSAAPGIWSVTEAENFISQRQWPGVVLRNNAWGYRAGGWVNTTAVYKYNFNTETAVSITGLTHGTGSGSSISTSNTGYVMGGYTHQTYAQRIRYLNDTWSVVSSMALSPAGWITSRGLGSNFNRGYVLGGYDGSALYSIRMQNLTVETAALLATSSRASTMIGMIANNNKIYACCGGIGGGTNCTSANYADILNLTTDAYSNGPNLGYCCGAMHVNTLPGATRGYVIGGYEIGAGCAGGGIQRSYYQWFALVYATDAVITLPVLSTLYPNGIFGSTTISNARNGYMFGGQDGNGSTSAYTNTITRINFATEAATNAGADLIANDYYQQGLC